MALVARLGRLALVDALLPQCTVRALSGAASASGGTPPNKPDKPAAGPSPSSAGSKDNADDAAEPSYMYVPPGSSLADPLLRYHVASTSMQEPVYFYDPAPSGPKGPEGAAARPGLEMRQSKQSRNVTITFQGPAAPKQQPGEDGQPVPLYVYLPPGSSMREPLSISLDDPVHIIDAKPEPKKP